MGQPLKSSLLDLPNEVLGLVGGFMEREADINALTQTNRFFHRLLNRDLYRRNVEKSGSSGLLWASENGCEATVRRFVDWGADPNVAGQSGDRRPAPLWSAARNGASAIVKLLLAQDRINPNVLETGSWGHSALTAAIFGDHEEVVELLLARDDVDPEATGESEFSSPLLIAAKRGNMQIVKMLLARGADPNRAEPERGRWFDTPLGAAVSQDHLAVVELLLARRVTDVNGGSNDKAWTPLHTAAKYAKIKIMELLLARDDVDVHAKARSGFTPLGEAARCKQPQKEQGLQLVLAHKNIDINAANQGPGGRGWSALHIAVRGNQMVLIKLLLAQDGVNMNPKDSEGRTPLADAAYHAKGDMVKLLLSYDGIDPNSRNIRGETPLMEAACYCYYRWAGHNPAVKILLARDDVDRHTTDIEGRTALDLALERRHEDSIRELLSSG